MAAPLASGGGRQVGNTPKPTLRWRGRGEIGQLMADIPYYDSARHKAWRAKVLRNAGYLCQICRKYGRLDKDGLPVRATIAHHIKPREQYPELALDIKNGMALCKNCHNLMHPEKGGAKHKPPR